MQAMRFPSCFAGRRRVGANEPTSSNFWAIFAVTLLLAAGASAFSVVSLSVRGGASHQYNALAIGREMASRGHRFTILLAKGETTRVGDQVTIVSRDPETWGNETSGVFVFYYDPQRSEADFQALVHDIQKMGPVLGLKTMAQTEVETLDDLIGDTVLATYLGRFVPDVALVDIAALAGNPFVQRLGVEKVATIVPLTLYHPVIYSFLTGRAEPSYCPPVGSGLSTSMSLLERARSWLEGSLAMLFVELFMYRPLGAAMTRHGIEPADIRWVNRNMPGFVFLTSPFGFEVPLPVYPHMVNVGPLLPQPGAPLAAEFEALLESPLAKARGGVIVACFGTYVSTGVNGVGDRIAAILNALPEYQIILGLKKVNQAQMDMAALGGHVAVFEYIPQNDLFADPRVRLAIHHAGHNSAMETAFHAQRTIAVPLAADQYDNADRLTDAGLAIRVDINDEAEVVAGAARALFDDPSMDADLARFAAIVKAMPRVGGVADHLEFLHVHGAAHLASPALTMPWWQVDSLDAKAVVGGVAVLVLWLAKTCCCWCCCGSPKAGGSKKGANRPKQQ